MVTPMPKLTTDTARALRALEEVVDGELDHDLVTRDDFYWGSRDPCDWSADVGASKRIAAALDVARAAVEERRLRKAYNSARRNDPRGDHTAIYRELICAEDALDAAIARLAECGAETGEGAS